jgi:hypothetical protein
MDKAAEEVTLLRDLGSRRRSASWHSIVTRSQKAAQQTIALEQFRKGQSNKTKVPGDAAD